MDALTLWKYHGGGNDFLLTDQFEILETWFRQVEPVLFIRSLTHRHFGIGADGFLLLHDFKGKRGGGTAVSTEPAYVLTYWNSDGSGNTFCGNGGRVSAYHYHLRNPEVEFPFSFQGWDGLHQVRRFEKGLGISFTIESAFEEVQVNGIEGFQIHTGSPHFLQLYNGSIFEHADFIAQAREIRYSSRYQKDGINVNWISILSEGYVQIRTYERGVEDETLSCGTGILAAALLYWKLGGGQNPVLIQARGGKFSVFQESEKRYWLIGPVAYVFQIELTFGQMTQILESFQRDYYEMQSMSE